MNTEQFFGLYVIFLFFIRGRTDVLAWRAYGDITVGLSISACMINLISWPFELYAIYWCFTNIVWYIPLSLAAFMMLFCGFFVSVRYWPFYMRHRTFMDLSLIFAGTYLFIH